MSCVTNELVYLKDYPMAQMICKRIPDCLDGANLQEWLPSETLPNLYEKSGLLEV